MNIHHRFGDVDNRIEVWVMKEYGVEGSWTKQYCFSTKVDWGLQTMYQFMIRTGMNDGWSLPSSKDQLLFSSVISKKEILDNFKLHPDLGPFIFDYSETLVPIEPREKDQFLFGS